MENENIPSNNQPVGDQTGRKEPEPTRISFFEPDPNARPIETQPTSPPEPADTPQTPQSFHSKPKNIFQIFKRASIVVILFILLISGSVWGYQTYVKSYQKITVEKLLPKDANLVTKLTINPDSKQFQALKNNLEKFPGYELLLKDIEKARQEQKSSSDPNPDKDLENMGLNFDSDIKPLLSDNAYIVIPDLKPLGNDLKSSLLVATQETKNLTRNLADMTASPEEKQLASLDKSDVSSDTRILGEENAKKDVKPLDFILASEIKDTKKAVEVLDKIKKSKNVTTIERDYSGYKYYSVKFQRDNKDKKETSSSGFKLMNYEEIFGAILGSNLVVTSREDYLKSAIDRKRAIEPISGMFSKAKPSSLADDTNYQNVMTDLEENAQEKFLSLYYNFNYDTLFKDESCSDKDYSCGDATQYFKYPENIISGFNLGFDDEGVTFKKTSNKISGSNFPNEPVAKSLASQIPLKLDGQWADVFFEETDLKTVYDNFKKNNLTDQGQNEWNKTLVDFKSETGMDLENDFINLINGNLALVMYSKKGSAPSGMVIAEISDQEKMLGTMRAMINKIKEEQIAEHESMLQYYTQPSSAMQSYYARQTPQQKAMRLETQKKYQTLLDAVKNSQITEKDVAGGKIYSYKIITEEEAFLPGFSLAISFGLGSGKMILGTDAASIESMMNGLADPAADKLAQNQNFKDATKYFFPENYTSTYINTIGIWNAVEYFINQFEESMISSQNKYCLLDGSPDQCAQMASESEKERKQVDEYTFAIGAIVRTVKLIGSSGSTSHEYIKGSSFVNIQSLPQEEKDRANKTLTTMHDDYMSARDKAKVANFKANMHSLQPAIIICCDDSSSNRLGATAGEAICSSGSVTSKLPKKDDMSSSTKPVYTVTADCSSSDPTITVSNVNAGTCTGATITSSTVSFSGC